MSKKNALFSLAMAAFAAPSLADDAATKPRLNATQGDGLTIEQAMDMAESHSFAVKIAGRVVDEASARSSQTAGLLGPKVAVDGSDVIIPNTVNKLAGETTTSGIQFPNRVEKAALMITEPLTGLGPILTKLAADAKIAKAALNDQQATAADARLLGADAFLRALKADRIYAIAAASEKVIHLQREDAAKLEKQGKISAVDVMRFDFSLSDAHMQLIQARAAVDVAALSLIETLGLPRGSEAIRLKASEASAFEEKKVAVPEVKALAAKAGESRPDLKSATIRGDAARDYASAAAWDYLPSLAGFARYERDFTVRDEVIPLIGHQGPPEEFRKEDYRDTLSYGLTLNWTIWDWNQRMRKRDELAATVEKARIAAESTASRVELEVAQAHAEMLASREALETARSSQRFAEEVYRATELKFKNGLATTTDLITAERDQTRARAQVANARGDLDLAWLKLKKSAGEKVGI